MITVPTIYDQSEAQITSDLSPPERRLPKWLSWLISITSPLQWLHDLIFVSYVGGDASSVWVTGTNYVYGNRVKDIDYAIYELTNTAGLSPSNTAPHLDSANWMKVLDTFVGIGERALYTGQKAMLEYILNYYFSVGAVSLPWNTSTSPSHTTQIFITTGRIGNAFWMTTGNTPLTGFMYKANGLQRSFMYSAPSFSPDTFTVHVPTATDAAIAANQVAGVTAESVVRSIVDKYCQAGKLYGYVTY